MRFDSAFFALGPSVFLILSLLLDWFAVTTFNKNAQIIGLERVKFNIFTASGALSKVRKSIPPGSVRNKIIALQVVGGLCGLGFVALTIYSIRHK